jgi:hypothetical protein
VEHAARAELRLELRALGIVRVLGLLLGVQVVEVPEELVEPVDGREELVAVAQVVLAELAGRVALGLQQVRDRRVCGVEPFGAPGRPTLRSRCGSGTGR